MCVCVFPGVQTSVALDTLISDESLWRTREILPNTAFDSMAKLALVFHVSGGFSFLALFFPLVNAHIHKNTNIRMIRSNMRTCHIFSQQVLSTGYNRVENTPAKQKLKHTVSTLHQCPLFY